jgi:hypothetical protein
MSLASRRVTGLATLVTALVALWIASRPSPRPSQLPPQPICLGDAQPLVVDHQMPYAQVSVAGRSGEFVLDFGATVSTITPAGFGNMGAPAPVAGTVDRYDGFVFFGPWGRVQLGLQPQAPVTSRVRQAGVIGTDFLAQHVYTLDYAGGRLYRAPRAGFCSDAVLAAAGYRALSTRDYYAQQPGTLSCPRAGGPGHCVNVPTVPVRIGPVQAVAQLDTGYDDGQQPYSLNINATLLEALQQAGVTLTRRPEIALQLSTCVAGVAERIEAWTLSAATPAGLVDEQGALLPQGAGATAAAITLFVKRTPAAAQLCGGIGTWAQPAAQLGASFVAGGAMVVDPFSARVWVR